MKSNTWWTRASYLLRALWRALLAWYCGVRASVDEWWARFIETRMVAENLYEVTVTLLGDGNRTPHRDGCEEIKVEGGSEAAQVELYLLVCRRLAEIEAETNDHR